MFDEKIYILILNYNCADESCECIRSIIENVNYLNYEIIVLDNASTDDSLNRLSDMIGYMTKQSEIAIRLVENGTNYGYAYGNNRGIELAIKEGADYICIMNPDVIAMDDFLTEMMRVMRTDESVGMVCPAGTDEKKPDYCMGAGSKIGILSGYTKILNRGNKIEDISPKLYECDYLGGMCILVKSELIKKIGLIPEEYFLFYEETEWCTKCRKAGYKCMADAETRMIHKGSVTVDRASDTTFNMHNYYMYRNRITFQRRNRFMLIYIIFLVYYFAELVYCRIKGNYGKEVWAAYIDGILDRDRLHHILGK